MLIVCIVLEENAAEVVPRVKAQIREYMVDFREHKLYFHVVKRNVDPVAGCYQSHFEAIEILAGVGRGLVLEEDVFFVYRFNLNELVRMHEESAGSGLLYLGYNSIVGCKNNDVSVVGQFFCGHAVVLLNPIKLLEYVRKYKFTPDQRHSMDVVLSTIPNSVGVYPMVAFQLPHVSALERRFANYNWQLCNNAERIYNKRPRSEMIYCVIALSKLGDELVDRLKYVPITYVYPEQPLTQIIIITKNNARVELSVEMLKNIRDNDVYLVSSDIWSMNSSVYNKYTIFTPHEIM
jgi:hypothetical protein